MSVSESAASAAFPRAWLAQGLRGEAFLSRLAKRGDPRAFEAIFERYHQELYRYCRAILGDPDRAQDALQSTMASALRALPGEGREIALRPWLYRVAHNEAISILRQQAHVDSARVSEHQFAPGADSEAEARERLRDLVADLDALPERQRGALVMRELSGLSYQQIGVALTASEGAARQAVYEARVALQELKEGRAMECDAVRRTLSERDGRVLRGRRLRAHLRACDGCRDFEAAISQRRSDLQAICPPLPAVAASGLLTTLLGQAGAGGVGAAGAGGGAAGIAGVAGTGMASSAAVKGASVVAAVVIGAGAMDISGAVDLPGVGHKGDSPNASLAPAAAERQAAAAVPGVGEGGKSIPNTSGGAPGSTGDNGRAHEPGGAPRPDGEHGSATAHGNAPASTGTGNLPATSNGSPPAHSSAGGNSNGHGHAGGQGGSHGSAPASPPGHAYAGSQAPSLPPQAHGKPGSPPGHDPAATHGSAGALPGDGA